MNAFSSKDAGAIVVAAGSGARIGGVPKQFRQLGGKPLIWWSARALVEHPGIKTVVVVHSPDGLEDAKRALQPFPITYALGGASRTQSVRAGLLALGAAGLKYVLIHDAARPGLKTKDIDALLEALDQYDGAAPGLPVSDTLKRCDSEGLVSGSLNRTGAFRIQTPQAFRWDSIWAAYQTLAETDEATDDLSVAQAAGLRLTLTQGDMALDKITYEDDFARMERTLFAQTSTRTGSGFDVHAFGPGDHVWLCGVKVPYSHGLIGHSDADVAWHALTDALLGAIADGDIGDHFPPSDEKWRGQSSDAFLKFAAERVRSRGGQIVNIDLTIIGESPKVKPHRTAMREQTAALLNIPLDAVSVKATTTERLGFLGRSEGLAAQAIVAVRL
jgi:2-C-methyl-D-erythritol 4-phosphate cytidylyltransferase/2-C-methyl-D-erythritol 2,4-cyclodiphosphate synthase